VNGELLFVAKYRFTALVQRTSNCDEIQNYILTPDKVLNVSMYGSPRALMISGRLNNRYM